MSLPSTKPWKLTGAPSRRSQAGRLAQLLVALSSSEPTFSRPTLGASRPSSTWAKTLPMTANSARLSASHSRLAPRSSITVSPRAVGRNEASAGRCAPSSMRMANIEMASSAPVLPAETTVSARPSAAASAGQPHARLAAAAQREATACRRRCTASSAGTISSALARPLRLSTSGLSRAGSPNSRKDVPG